MVENREELLKRRSIGLDALAQVSVMVLGFVWIGVVGGCAASRETKTDTTSGGSTMQLGNFSVSLAVKDLAASKAFYQKLGLRPVGGDGKNYLIMQNETSTIGLFQGMFEKNILTFNPGWDRACQTLPAFQDVRDLQRLLESRGLTPVTRADESTAGPASFMVVDPDGNPILIDQHVAKPGK
jgi:catechol 2,3-dioxygenase-like lactoylglutathione lyase family enzyme